MGPDADPPGGGAELPGLLRWLGGLPARRGTVYLVGAGPGDPGLLTLRGAVLLSTCDLVLYDRLAPPEALDLAPPGAERRCVGKRPGGGGPSRAEVDALMVEAAAEGRAVVRLKGGDPFVFGRGGEEAEALALAGVPYEVVGGVTSATAVPGAAGIPATHRGAAAGFAVVTGHEDPRKDGGHVDLPTLARFSGTLLVLMGVRRLKGFAAALIRHGRDPATPASMVSWGTTPRQRVVEATLGDLADRAAEAGLGPPAVIVIGEVARLRSGIAWREGLPLHGVSVLVTRTRQQAPALSARIRSLGGEPVEAPTIELRRGDAAALTAALDELASGGFAGLALTSPNGVDAVADALAGQGRDARALAGARVAVVGPGTARRLWERLRVRPDLQPDRSTTAALGEAFPEGRGRVLLPRADIAGPALRESLASRGYEPVQVTAYRTVPPDGLPPAAVERLAAGEVDLVAFASASTVRHFHRLIGDRPWSGRVVSIGPVTSATCRELGYPVAAEAERHDLDGLLDALCAAAAGRRAGGDG